MENSGNTKQRKENPLINIGCNVIIPSVIMTKFSGDEHLGQVYGLVVALIFPIAYGLADLIRFKKTNIFSIIGLVSVMLTGGIGLWGTSRNWITVKETAIPLLIGIAVLIAQWRGYSVMKIFLEQIMDLEKVKDAFNQKGHAAPFLTLLKNSSYMLAGTFFVSAFLNLILVLKILKGDPGTVIFNQTLGKMMALSFPVIALPTMILMVAIIWHILSKIKKETDLSLEEILRK